MQGDYISPARSQRMPARPLRYFRLTPSHAQKLNKRFYATRNARAADEATIARRLTDAGFIVPKKGATENGLFRLTQAGSCRLILTGLLRKHSFNRMSSAQRMRCSTAFLIDLIHEQRLAHHEAFMRRWVRFPSKPAKRDAYGRDHVISDVEVAETMNNMRRRAREYLRSRLLLPPSSTISPSELAQARGVRSLKDLLVYSLDQWKSPMFRKAIFNRSLVLWREAMEIQRERAIHERWEKLG